MRPRGFDGEERREWVFEPKEGGFRPADDSVYVPVVASIHEQEMFKLSCAEEELRYFFSCRCHVVDDVGVVRALPLWDP